jgi:hypothetical protein
MIRQRHAGFTCALMGAALFGVPCLPEAHAAPLAVLGGKAAPPRSRPAPAAFPIRPADRRPAAGGRQPSPRGARTLPRNAAAAQGRLVPGAIASPGGAGPAHAGRASLHENPSRLPAGAAAQARQILPQRRTVPQTPRRPRDVRDLRPDNR